MEIEWSLWGRLLSRYTVKKASDFPFPAGMSLTFFYTIANQSSSKLFRKKGTGMSVDTDKGIDDLPPDADTIRDPTHTLFSWRKILFILGIGLPQVLFIN